MISKSAAYSMFSAAGAPFLPLAFRLAASFGLIVIQLALPGEPGRVLPRENLYIALLLIFFLESLWEVGRNIARTSSLFGTPDRAWVRWNLTLDILLIALLISFQGVDQERFATIYIFPVLASAFYLRITEIVAVGALSTLVHISTVLLFTMGVIPAFGRSNLEMDPDLSQQAYLLSFASLQILSATLVVVLIRKHLETLRNTLRQSEAAVDKLSTLYGRVFESMFSGLIITDMEGRITSANPAAEHILKRPLPVGGLVSEMDFVDITAHGVHPMEQRFQTTFAAPDGSHRIVGGNVAPIRDTEGTQQGHLLLFQDLTDIKALEERTRLSERMATIGELAASLAHELRNPMASILGCVQLLRQGEPSAQLMERVLTILHRESERVSTIVTDFLAFAKPRASRLQSLWFPSVLDEVMASWETDPRCTGLDLTHGEPPQVWVSGDPMSVHQIFTNLLSNARKAVQGVERPSIRLQFRMETGHVEVLVEDNGCGMTEEQRQTIFLPFTTGFAHGTGLGMSLVYQFVRQMAWDIQVESTLHHGTRIALRIPLTAPSESVPD